MKFLGQRLAAAREAKGLTQSAAAEALGICRSALSKWESGLRVPSLKALRKVVALYDVTYDALLTEVVK